MRGKWGKTWLALLMVSFSLICAPLMAGAADSWDKGGMSSFPAGAQTSLEAQMLGEKPFQARPAPVNSGAALLSGATSGLQLDQAGGAALKLPYNLEMRISVHYGSDKSEAAPLEPQKRSDALLMRSSLDYRLLSNLKVGLNAYLYRPDPADNLYLARPFGDRVMGLGPEIKYDLGRWSFLMKSQVETGERKDMQNWIRVWYAF